MLLLYTPVNDGPLKLPSVAGLCVFIFTCSESIMPARAEGVRRVGLPVVLVQGYSLLKSSDTHPHHGTNSVCHPDVCGWGTAGGFRVFERCLTFNRDSKSFHQNWLFSEFVSVGCDPVSRLHGPMPSFKPGLNLLLVERRSALSLLTMFRQSAGRRR